MEFIGFIVASIIVIGGIGLLFWTLLSSLDYLYEGSVENSAEWSIYKKIRGVFRAVVKRIKLKPKTPLQKEIEAEAKEIEILEQQKADMKELERLKARREKLFTEVDSKSRLEWMMKRNWCPKCEEWYEGDNCICWYAKDPTLVVRAFTPLETEKILKNKNMEDE